MQTGALFSEAMDEIQVNGAGNLSGPLFIALIDSINNP